MSHQIVDAARLPFRPVAGAASPEVLAAAAANGAVAGRSAGGAAGEAAARAVVAPAVAAIPDRVISEVGAKVPPAVTAAMASDAAIAQAAVNAVSAAVEGMDTVLVTNAPATSTATWSHPTTDWVEATVKDTVGASTTVAIPGQATWPQVGADGKLDPAVLPIDPTLDSRVTSNTNRVGALESRVGVTDAAVSDLRAQVAAVGTVWADGVPLTLAAGLTGSLTVSETVGQVRVAGTVSGVITAGMIIATGPGYMAWTAGQSAGGVHTTLGGLQAVAAGSSLTVNAVLRKPTLPVIYVQLADPAAVIDNENYLPATVTVDMDGTGQVLQSFTTKFRGHGNSTWGGAKKPYRFKNDAKVSLLGMPANKNWRLLANFYDKSRVRPTVLYDLGHDLKDALGWTPNGRWAELVVMRGDTGTYMGLYDVRENVAISGSRLDIDELNGDETDPLEITGGWLLEADNKEAATVSGFTTTRYGQFIAYDSPEEPAAAQQVYIAGFMNLVEDEIATGDLTHVHVPSFAAWWAINELVRNTDSPWWSSCKLWKPRATLAEDGTTIIESQVHAGPLWDADLSIGTGPGGTNAWRAPASGWRTRTGGWYPRLFAIPAFASAAKTTMQGIIASLDTVIIPRLDGHVTRVRQALAADHAAQGEADLTASEIVRIKQWLRARAAWITTNL